MSDNSWYEKGEPPPVGSVVEFCNKKEEKERICIDDWKNGDQLEVLAVRKVGMDDLPIVFNIRDKTASAVIMAMIKPIKTERELSVEEIKSIIVHQGWLSADGTVSGEIANKIYDSGYRKIPTLD